MACRGLISLTVGFPSPTACDLNLVGIFSLGVGAGATPPLAAQVGSD
jgi:hypothetical protein